MDKKDVKIKHILKTAIAKYSKDNLVIAIPRYMSLTFTSYCAMREDLLRIKKYLEQINITRNKLLTSSLIYSLIVLYGKCFTDATNIKAPKLEPNQLFVNKENLRETHDFLIDLRHHFIAHRGDTDGEVNAAYLLIPKENGVPQVRFSGLKQISFNRKDRVRINELVDYLLDCLEIKIKKSGQKTYDNLIKSLSPTQISLLAINNCNEEE